MGVPRLFKWICDQYPNVVKTYRTNYINVRTIDNVYIDANAIIHNCAQVVFNYGEKKRLLYRYSNLSFDEKLNLLYKKTFDKIVEIIEFIVPTKMLYIAIDGVAPAGKMAQQRQRRFIAVRNTTNTDIDEHTFNPNCITPGTEFMYNLKMYFQFRILELVEKKKIQIVFSPSDVPGEGEHKLLDHIRTHTKGEVNAMYGPDGDLFMLALGISCKKMFLVRDNPQEVNITNLIDISFLKRELLKDVRNINDFILMGFLVGNDFLPKIQMFYFLEDGMNFMMEKYKEFKKPLTFKEEINFKNLFEFCQLLQKDEEKFLLGQIEKAIEMNETTGLTNNLTTANSFSTQMKSKFQNKTLLDCYYNENFNYEKYQKLYNEKIQNSENLKYLDMKRLVTDYMVGIKWVFEYYLVGFSSNSNNNVPFGYDYKHYYAPLMIDIINNFNFTFIRNFKFKLYQPHLQFQQLLAILPKKSKNLLPKELYYLYEDDSPLAKYQKYDFDIDYEGKYKEYQGIALLPFVNYDDLCNIYNKIHIDHKYNRIGKTLIFNFCEKKKKYRNRFFESKYFVKIEKE